MQIAIIDLGTTMFKLSIKESADSSHNIFIKYVNVELTDGISGSSKISEQAYSRALNAIQEFREILDSCQVKHIYAVGTSALRHAENSAEIVARIKHATDIDVDIISGEQEAYLIYRGVKEAVDLSSDRNEIGLIMDIGGGSVEFILCNDTRVFWAKSFEIGVKRMLDQFTDNTCLQPAQLASMEAYLTQCLQPLLEQLNIYLPACLIGSSGAFRTLGAVLQAQGKIFIPPKALCYHIPLEAFVALYQAIRFTKREERFQIQGNGVDDVSRDMITLNLALIYFVVQKMNLKHIIASTYALKEGLFFAALDKINDTIVGAS